MKKKKRAINIVIMIAIVSSSAWIAYKTIIYSTYRTFDIMNTEFKEVLKNVDEKSIKTDKTLANTKFHNLNMKILDDLVEKNLNTNSKTYSNEFGTMNMWIIKDTTYEKSEAITKDDYTKKYGFNYEKLTKKYDINNEYDFIEYIKNGIDKKPNIFWSKSHLQMNYIAYNWMATLFISHATCNKITLLNGDLTGVIGEGNNMVQIHLINDDETYFIRLNKKIYTDEKIDDLLNSIYFD